jgi:hypothetical protein
MVPAGSASCEKEQPLRDFQKGLGGEIRTRESPSLARPEQPSIGHEIALMTQIHRNPQETNGNSGLGRSGKSLQPRPNHGLEFLG